MKNNTAEEISFSELFMILWRGRKMIILITILSVVFGAVYFMSVTPLYRSTITLYSVYDNSPNPLSMMARQLGVAGTGMVASANYNIPDVVKSRSLAEKIVRHEWDIEGYEKKVTLFDYFSDMMKRNPPSDLKTEEEKREWHQDLINRYSRHFANQRVSAKVSQDTNLITVSVDMEQPRLARDIANFISVFVTDWINNVQKSSVEKNLEFISSRLLLAEEDLTEAENELKIFRETNRNITSSPDLQLEVGRFQRQVLIRQEVYLTLVKQKEIAQIEHNKSTDVIRIVDTAIRERKPFKPKLRLILALTFTAGIIMGSIIVVLSYLISGGFTKDFITKNKLLVRLFNS